MRWLGFLLAILLPIVIGGPRNKARTPNYAERPIVRSVPVALDRTDSARTRVGALTLLGGWRLSSHSSQFGGWSALHVDGDRFTAIGDSGVVLRFRLSRFGRVIDPVITPLPASCRQSNDNRTRDSESLASDGRSWWVGYESRHRICRLDADFRRGLAVHAPPPMKRWPYTGGAEAMLRLQDGRFLVFGERPPRGGDMRQLLVFAGDPADARTPMTILRYRPPQGFSPTDAAQLPDGRILVLNRRFSLWDQFTTAISIVDLEDLTPGATVEGRVLARFARPLVSDNFEGLAVTREGDRTIVWMISDDNSMTWQATYLLKFQLDDGSGRPIGRGR